MEVVDGGELEIVDDVASRNGGPAARRRASHSSAASTNRAGGAILRPYAGVRDTLTILLLLFMGLTNISMKTDEKISLIFVFAYHHQKQDRVHNNWERK
jgi:hypothetical protein